MVQTGVSYCDYSGASASEPPYFWGAPLILVHRKQPRDVDRSGSTVTMLLGIKQDKLWVINK